MDDSHLDRLLERVRHGDAEAARALFDLAAPPLHRFLFRLTRSADAAEDLVQATFLALWRARDRYRGDGRARTYLFKIALNAWRQWQRRERRASEREAARPLAESLSEPLVTDPDSLEALELSQLVREAVDRLPPKQREVLVLHRFEELSCREIAEILGEPVKTVESRLRLALEKITQRLRKLGSPP